MTTKTKARRSPSSWRLNREAWRGFLLARVVGRYVLTPSQQRGIHRWLHGATASLWTADRHLVELGLHTDDFFAHCRTLGVSPYADGHDPADD